MDQVNPFAKRAPFYPLAPGLGKRAAMLFLKVGCGEPAVFAVPMAPAARGGRAPFYFAWGCFRDFMFGPAAHRPHRFEDARERAMRLCTASGIRDAARGLRLFRPPGGTRLTPP
jgi:hypothetical protein